MLVTPFFDGVNFASAAFFETGFSSDFFELALAASAFGSTGLLDIGLLVAGLLGAGLIVTGLLGTGLLGTGFSDAAFSDAGLAEEGCTGVDFADADFFSNKFLVGSTDVFLANFFSNAGFAVGSALPSATGFDFDSTMGFEFPAFDDGSGLVLTGFAIDVFALSGLAEAGFVG